MERLGIHDLEVIYLGIKGNGNFNETDIEHSDLKKLGVGRILDLLASLKERKMIDMNRDGTFSITDLARNTLWNNKTPTWFRILRILEIKPNNLEPISTFLTISEAETFEVLENLRKNQLILMSPLRHEDKILKVYEILPEGIDKIKHVEKHGFDNVQQGEINSRTEIIETINEIIVEINKEQEIKRKKEIISKLNQIKTKLER